MRKAVPARAHLVDVVLNDKRVVAVRNIPAALIDVEEVDNAASAAGATSTTVTAKQLCDARLFALGQHFLFGQYGRIVGAVVIYSGQGLNRMPIYSAAIRYASSDEAARCVKFANGSSLLGQILSCKLVPTRYCGQFLLKSMCNKRMCVELHHEHTDKTLHVKPPPAVFSVLGAAESLAPQVPILASSSEDLVEAEEFHDDAPGAAVGREVRRLATRWANNLALKVRDDIHRAIGVGSADEASTSQLFLQSSGNACDVALTPLTKMVGQQSTLSFELSTPLTSTLVGGEASWSQGSPATAATTCCSDVQLRARMAMEAQSWLCHNPSSSLAKHDDVVVTQCNDVLKAVIENMPPHVPTVEVHAALPHPTIIKSRSSDAAEASLRR